MRLFLAVSIYDFSFLEASIGQLPGRTITAPFFLWLLRGCYLAVGPQEWAPRLPAFIAGLAALFPDDSPGTGAGWATPDGFGPWGFAHCLPTAYSTESKFVLTPPIFY